jgi:hypothetical protein
VVRRIARTALEVEGVYESIDVYRTHWRHRKAAISTTRFHDTRRESWSRAFPNAAIHSLLLDRL